MSVSRNGSDYAPSAGRRWSSSGGSGRSSTASILTGMHALVIPARRYATTTCIGDVDAIERAYAELARWITENGLHADRAGLGLERYDVRRQRPTPPYDRFDYDILRPLAD